MAKARNANAGKVEVTFDLSKFKGVSCRAFTIRETDGFDEEMACDAAAKEEGSIGPTEQIVRMAITAVNGKRVEGGMFLGYEGWNTRTRTLALRAYNKVNGVDEKAMRDFLTQGEVSEASDNMPLAASPNDDNSDGDNGDVG